MNLIKLALVATILLPTGLWLLADTARPQPFTYFAFRDVFMQYSGVVAIAVMSVAMLLAMRPGSIEPHLDGLDKMYRLHKWLGITALAVSVLHWWWAQGTQWMVGWGWLTRPPRGPRPDASQLGAVEGWLGSLRGLAESVGEWAFYAAAVLLVLALVKRFPYHLFGRRRIPGLRSRTWSLSATASCWHGSPIGANRWAGCWRRCSRPAAWRPCSCCSGVSVPGAG